MDFLKKHYEKILLGVVLIGLAGAAACLPFIIASEKQKLASLTEAATHPNPKPLTNLDLSMAEAALARVTTVATINFGAPNRLFNPMPWQQTADKLLIPGNKVGPDALVVTNIAPLYLRISLDKTDVGDTGPKYALIIEKPTPGTFGQQKTKRQSNCSLNPPTKDKDFTMVEVKGKPEDPSQIIVELNDTKQKAVIAKDKPYERVEGYVADLRYDPEKKSWGERRVGAVLPFNGEDYRVVAISQNEVVLSAKSNGKKSTIKAAASSP